MKNNFKILILFFLVPVFVFVSLRIGYSSVNSMELVQILFGKGSDSQNLVVFTLRMPRIIIGALVGIGFAVSGTIIQSITKNPLADPGILGINAGASFVVVLFTTLQTSIISFHSIFLMPFMAAIGGAFIGVIIYILSTDKIRGLNPTRLILNGIALQSGINGIMMTLILMLDSDQFDFITQFQSGSIWSANWQQIYILLPWILILLLITYTRTKELDLLTLREEVIVGVGVNSKKEKKILLALAIFFAGGSVAFGGSISFVGLISPHIARRIVGPRHKYLIIASGLMGALLMIVADTIARKIIEPSQLPTRLVVAIIGAPYFIYLFLRENKRK
ncbi:MAG: FecCD family ABC transporter permease [Lachnospirales bacterium]